MHLAYVRGRTVYRARNRPQMFANIGKSIGKDIKSLRDITHTHTEGLNELLLKEFETHVVHVSPPGAVWKRTKPFCVFNVTVKICVGMKLN